jgi:iron complex transport system ATP-binding protein
VLSNPAPAAQVRAAVATTAGPWPVALEVDGTWRPLRDLRLEPVRDEVCGRIAATVGGCEPRVAQSTLVLGLAARLWSLTVGCVAQAGVLPDLEQVGYTDDRGSVRLGLLQPQGWLTTDPQDVYEVVVSRTLLPILTTMPLSARLLWGNVASALAGTARVLDLPSAGLVAALLDLPLLHGELDPDGRRGTCCLFYRVPGAGLCGDCVLDAVPAL